MYKSEVVEWVNYKGGQISSSYRGYSFIINVRERPTIQRGLNSHNQTGHRCQNTVQVLFNN